MAVLPGLGEFQGADPPHCPAPATSASGPFLPRPSRENQRAGTLFSCTMMQPEPFLAEKVLGCQFRSARFLHGEGYPSILLLAS